MARQAYTDERGSVHGVNPGTELGRYTVETRIEEIPGGERWNARDTTLDRDVTLIVMPADAPALKIANTRALGAEVTLASDGVEALERILMHYPADCPPTLITQHMPAEFLASLAQRLDRTMAPRVALARDGAPLAPGYVHIAPGADTHLVVTKADDGRITRSGVREVGEADRERELARMMSGMSGSQTAVDHARELLDLARGGRPSRDGGL